MLINNNNWIKINIVFKYYISCYGVTGMYSVTVINETISQGRLSFERQEIIGIK